MPRVTRVGNWTHCNRKLHGIFQTPRFTRLEAVLGRLHRYARAFATSAWLSSRTGVVVTPDLRVVPRKCFWIQETASSLRVLSARGTHRSGGSFTLAGKQHESWLALLSRRSGTIQPMWRSFLRRSYSCMAAPCSMTRNGTDFEMQSRHKRRIWSASGL